jgi:5-dehydro-2-deoxygluconokinase
MPNPNRLYDSLHMGRSGIDLYGNEVGVPFVEIKSFAAYVGGSPTNISVGGRRLGLKSVLPNVDIVIGTDDEINAAMLTDPGQLHLTHSQISDARVEGDTERAIETILGLGPRLLVQKRGTQGSRVHLASGEKIDAPGFPVQVYNILGAGDALASGLIYGYVQGWDWYKAARMGHACGAIVVTRHGCSGSMALYPETVEFIEQRGGF